MVLRVEFLPRESCVPNPSLRFSISPAQLYPTNGRNVIDVKDTKREELEVQARNDWDGTGHVFMQ